MRDTLIFIAVVAVLLYSFGVPSPDGADTEKADVLRKSAQTYIVESHKQKWGIDEDEVECGCNGTGYITHGDGHRTPCFCVANDGKCNCKSN